MTEAQLHTLQHALGLDQYGRGAIYRNHYVGGAKECRPLVALGYMEEFRASDLTGGDPLFRVTEGGKKAVLSESPKEPKLTRAQMRYRHWLKVADAFGDMTFGEWLKLKESDR